LHGETFSYELSESKGNFLRKTWRESKESGKILGESIYERIYAFDETDKGQWIKEEGYSPEEKNVYYRENEYGKRTGYYMVSYGDKIKHNHIYVKKGKEE